MKRSFSSYSVVKDSRSNYPLELSTGGAAVMPTVVATGVGSGATRTDTMVSSDAGGTGVVIHHSEADSQSVTRAALSRTSPHVPSCNESNNVFIDFREAFYSHVHFCIRELRLRCNFKRAVHVF
jgi:hypothetical protein